MTHFHAHSRRIAQALVLSGLLGVMAAGPAKADFFDFLFHPQQQAQPQAVYYAQPNAYPAPRSGLAPAFRSKAHAAKPSRAIANAADKVFGESRDKAMKPTPPVAGVGPLGPFVNDPTLRSGDVVVTSSGIRVFHGPSEHHHTASDFVALAQSQFNTSNYRALAQIETANKLAPKAAPDAVAQASSSTQVASTATDAPATLTVRGSKKAAR